MEQVINKPTLILFDVYETLLDMSEMEKRVNHLMDSKRGYQIWLELFMQYCFVDNCTIQFNNFTSIAKATMEMTAKTLGTSFGDDDAENVLKLLHHLPLHEGVQNGLSILNNEGFRIAALTNSPEKTVTQRMESTGLISYFEMVLSAEHVKKYKPCIEVYEWAANKLELDIQKILLVSSHGWDIVGGANAGMQTAYVRQSRSMLYPLAPQPTITCQNLVDLANQLSKKEEVAISDI